MHSTRTDPNYLRTEPRKSCKMNMYSWGSGYDLNWDKRLIREIVANIMNRVIRERTGGCNPVFLINYGTLSFVSHSFNILSSRCILRQMTVKFSNFVLNSLKYCLAVVLQLCKEKLVAISNLLSSIPSFAVS